MDNKRMNDLRFVQLVGRAARKPDSTASKEDQAMEACVTAFNAIKGKTLTAEDGRHFLELLKMVYADRGIDDSGELKISFEIDSTFCKTSD